MVEQRHWPGLPFSFVSESSYLEHPNNTSCPWVTRKPTSVTKIPRRGDKNYSRWITTIEEFLETSLRIFVEINGGDERDVLARILELRYCVSFLGGSEIWSRLHLIFLNYRIETRLNNSRFFWKIGENNWSRDEKLTWLDNLMISVIRKLKKSFFDLKIQDHGNFATGFFIKSTV